MDGRGRAIAAALIVWPWASYAQEQVGLLDPGSVRIATLVWLIGFSLLGWLASDLPKLAGWVDASLNSGNLLKTRLEILQGFVSAELAGFIIYFVGKSSPKWLGYDTVPPEMLLFVFVGVAGFSGAKVLNMIRDKIVK